MAPAYFKAGLLATLLATPCGAFITPAGPAHSVLHGVFPSRVASSTPLEARRIALGSRTSRLAFSPLNPDGDDAAAADASRATTAASMRGLAAGSRGVGKASGALKAISDADSEDLGSGVKDLTAVRRALVLTIWVAFVAYALGPWSPGSTGDPKDVVLATELFSVLLTPASPETAIFSCFFTALAFLPGAIASVLIGGGAFGKGRQPVPPQPFVFGAFALGFIAVGPYLAVRNYLPRSAMEEGEEMSTLEKALTSKIFAAPVLALAVTTSYYLVSALANPAAISGFSELFWSSKFAHVSTLDFAVLSVLIVDPIREDMRRRGVEPEAAKVALYGFPLVGPALWLLVRPPTES
ncbi:unnamed protein product [Scytosiphon promiscuus]